MAIISSQPFTGNGSIKNFTILGELLSESHLTVWLDGVQVSSDDWDLVGNTVLFHIAPTGALIFEVSSTGTDNPVAPSDVSIISSNIADINTVADNIGDINTVEDSITAVNSLAGIIIKLNSLYADKATLDSLFNDKAILDSLFADKLTLNGLYASKAAIDALFVDLTNLNTIHANLTEILLADDNATIATAQAGIATNAATNASASESIVVAKEALINPHYGNIDTVAANTVDIDTVAANSGNVSIIGNDLSNSWEHIEDAGAIIDPVTGGTGTSLIETVSDNIANVNIVGTNIANVNTVAAQDSNITDISTQVIPNIAEILLADDNAGIATAQAGIATTKAGEASTSEANALTYKNASEAARDSALAALDSFDDRYLGQKASDPTVDNDGNPLVAGALYFNTTDDVMKVYEGSLWVAAYASLSGALLVNNNLSDLASIVTARTNLQVDSSIEVTAKVDTHGNLTNNPHGVTASQVGLGTTDDVSFGSVTADLSGAFTSTAKNVSVSTILKGTPVYQSGTFGNGAEVQPADASNTATMPAIGVLAEDLAPQAEGTMIHMGFIQGVDTSTFSEGDTIYVGSGGGYTNVPPAGEGNLLQNLGKVLKVHATNGSGIVMGAGRSNATPNLNQGNVFIGNASNQSEARVLQASDISDFSTVSEDYGTL